MSQRMTEGRYEYLRDVERDWNREEQREATREMKRARSEEARLLEENTQKDAALVGAYMTPSLLAWRAESPHGFSRVYADDAAQAQERGAMAQRCEAGAVTVTRWSEEDLCKAAKKDATIAALASALRRAEPFVTDGETAAEVDAALRLAGRIT